MLFHSKIKENAMDEKREFRVRILFIEMLTIT